MTGERYIHQISRLKRSKLSFVASAPVSGQIRRKAAIAFTGDKMWIPLLIQVFVGDVLQQISGRVSKPNEKFKD
ncbi:hypothetical protein [Oscillatoria sp. HE19RPO]|uniref:hypothetical protein n=1 Tax=Oscillatoria sp. HE19RPO TaxID=2954806 RepID=UPI0020C23F86|nr:hypothetical protein [Oscillatoria sp. HE19RPO]